MEKSKVKKWKSVAGGLLLAALGAQSAVAASEHVGQVTFTGLGIPGVSVTASQGDTRIVATSDPQGIYRFPELADGTWTIRVEMLGFSPMTREITLPSPEAKSATWELVLLPFEEITRGIEPVKAAPAVASSGTATAPASGARGAAGAPAPAASQPGFQRAGVNASATAAARPATPPPAQQAEAPANDPFGAADGFLVNGSVNNGAASPFAQLAMFGNNRPGGRSLYNGGIAVLAGNSAWDARPFSFTGQQAPKPSYNDIQFNGTFGGPLRIPGLLRNGGVFMVGLQRLNDSNAITQPGRVPTLLERAGDFSQSRDAAGRPVQVRDPLTGLPFPGNRIPANRISPQAAALLGYYPQPNIDGAFNYQQPLLTTIHTDGVQGTLTRAFRGGREQLQGTVNLQETTTTSTSVFGFTDTTESATLNTAINWTHRVSQFMSTRARYQLTRNVNQTTPHFANLANVSGEAGITGNSQDPNNWGPPALNFAGGFEPLRTAQYADNTTTTHAWSGEVLTFRGRHNMTIGGVARRHVFDVFSQQDARGSFAFTGAATGSDFGDFLLGLPQTSSIAFGNPDKFLRGTSYDAFVNDDWRVSPSLTLNLGLRWEYESPITERFGRLVNLDIASGFTGIAPVLASDPIGTLTGSRYEDSLVSPDKRGVQPRLGAAWRPIPGSSLVVRGGWGIYRNTNVYQAIALAMAQQPPLSTSASVQSTPAAPLTLANGFAASAGAGRNTFAIDPNFRAGYAQNWQLSAQRDLPASLTVLATYLGSKGSHLVQEFLPNTYAPGAVNPCASCPSGFIYVAANGSSVRNAGQIQLRRRLRNGLTASGQYTLSKATDNAAAFTTASLNPGIVAQNWLDLDAEQAPSSFDQRHQFTAQFQYTTGVGVTGGSLVDGVRGRLLKDWTFVSQLTVGSGAPMTPFILSPIPGTGLNGPLRPNLTGEPIASNEEGRYLNPAAFAVPAAGEWGNAGRNSVTGPRQFQLNAAIGRTFRWGPRFNLDWRVDMANIANRVSYSGLNLLVGSPQFGLPVRPNPMRKIQTSLRLRF